MSKQKQANKAKARNAKLAWTDHAWEDYLYWLDHDPAIIAEINSLLEECFRTPFAGTGKPELLSGDLSGFVSRRITKEHRLVYLPADGLIYVVQCRYHY